MDFIFSFLNLFYILFIFFFTFIFFKESGIGFKKDAIIIIIIIIF